jgi:hypothetical protein
MVGDFEVIRFPQDWGARGQIIPLIDNAHYDGTGRLSIGLSGNEAPPQVSNFRQILYDRLWVYDVGLFMSEIAYAPPVSELLELGEKSVRAKHPTDYIEQFGFTDADIPELIRMVLDEDLNWANQNTNEVWAPLHAWRSLGLLKAEAAIEPLVSKFNEMWEDDWFNEDMPDVFAQIGPAAIPALRNFFDNSENWFYSRWTAISSLVKIAQAHPDVRDVCVEAMTQHLEHFNRNNREWNGVVISSLLDLNAVEAAPLMEQAFKTKWVDTSIPGDWPEVQHSLGLISRSEVVQRRKHVDAEHIAAKAHLPTTKADGFGASSKSKKKKKKKK